jgi:branched-chain amino acid transport system permease protein
VRDLLQLLTSGSAQGLTYGLIAIGFVSVYSVSRVINIAQGQFAAVAGLLAITLCRHNVPLLAACSVAILATTALALVIERVVIAPTYGAPPVRHIVLTLGVLIALEGATLLIWGPDSAGLQPFTSGTLSAGGVVVPAQDAWIVAVTVLVAAALWVFATRTRAGKAFRACAEQPVAARLVGISPSHVYRVGFALAGAVGAIGGLVISPVQLTSWDTGLTLGLKGFVAASLAGLVSVPGALAGGVVLGVAESLAAGYLNSGTADATAYLVLIVVLMVRPQGLVGAPGERV